MAYPKIRRGSLSIGATLVVFAGLLVPAYVYPGLDAVQYLLKVGARSLLVLYLLLTVNPNGWKLFFPKFAQFHVLYVFCGLALISTIYSADPAFSIERSLDLLLFIVVAARIVAILDSFPSCVRLAEFLLGTYLTAFFPLCALLDQSMMRQMGLDGVERIGGFVINPNLFAYCSLFLFYINFYWWVQRHRRTPVFLGLSACYVILILLTYSRSALGLLATSLFLMANQLGKTSRRIFWPAALIGGLIVAMLFNEEIFTFLERGHGAENVMTLGGRITIWEPLLQNLGDGQLWYGYGYQMLSSSGLAYTSGELSITMAHNNILQSFLGLGIFGLLLCITFWLLHMLSSVNAAVQRSSPHNYLVLQISLATFLFSMVEFGIFGPSNVLTPMFLIISFASARYLRPSVNVRPSMPLE